MERRTTRNTKCDVLATSNEPLSAQVRAFITESISSVARLHLLLFVRNRRERPWNGDDAAFELRSNPRWVQAELEHLEQRALLVREGQSFRYAASPDVDAIVAALDQAYQTYPVAVIGAIYPPEREENRALRQFADAFRLRREPEPPKPGKEEPHG